MATLSLRANKDAMMGKQIVGGTFSGWNGKDNHLPVGVSAGGSYKYRCVVGFNIDFTPMVSITSATLTLYDNGDSGSANLHCFQASGTTSTIRVSRVTKDWAEGSYDPGEGVITGTLDYDWDNRSSSYSETNQVSLTAINQASNGAARDWDVTDIVKQWFDGTNNYGFMIRNANETNSDNGVQFYSRSFSNSDYWPKLTIVYTTNTAPTAPTLSSPINGDVQNTLTPTFTGSKNDADTGDYITAASISVWGAGNRYLFSTTTTSADPGSGNFRFNNSTLSSATAIYVSKTDADNHQISAASFTASSTCSIVSASSSAYYTSFVIGTPTDNGTWLSIPISSVSAGTKPTAGQSILLDGSADYNKSMWSGGTVTFTGSPTTFSILFGQTGTATALSGNRFYKWLAATADKASAWSPNSSYAYFKTNTPPNSPDLTVTSTPTSDITTNTPSFSITHSDNDPDDTKMYAYRLVIEKETSPGSGVWQSDGGYDSTQVDLSGSPVVTTSVTSAALGWGGSYRAKALTMDSNNSLGSYSAWRAFSLHSTGVPTNLFPSSGQATSLTPTFTGSRSNTTDVITSFDIEVRSADLGTQIYLGSGLTSSIVAGASVSNTYSGAALSVSTTYNWRMRVTANPSGLVSDWSAWIPFTTQSASVPAVVTPVGTGNTTTPSINVTRASAFTNLKYEFYASTASDSNPGTALDAVTVGTFASSTNKTVSYAGTALSYNTSYRIRAAVYDSAWSDWAWASFSTASAGLPTLYGVDSQYYSSTTPWTTSLTPTFIIDGYSTEVVDRMQVRVYNASNPTLPVWVSSDYDVTEDGNGRAALTLGSATRLSSSYATALTAGVGYLWDAKYTNTSGFPGDFSAQKSFRVNGAPNVPGNMAPTNNIAYSDTLTPTFYADFSDPDPNDAPSGWYITIQGYNGGSWTDVATKSILSSLSASTNAYTWGTSDYTFEYGKEYQWKAYFSDSKLANGTLSSPQAFQFVTAPTVSITSPAGGTVAGTPATVNTVIPTITWSYSNTKTQQTIRIDIDRTDSAGTVINGTRVTTGEITQTATSYTFPVGYLVAQKYYKISLTATNSVGISSTASVRYIYIDTNAPGAVTGVNVYTGNGYWAEVSWDQGVPNSGQTFTNYKIQRRVLGDTTWTTIGYTSAISSTSFIDYYAGLQVTYQWQVIMSVTSGSGGTTIESVEPDTPATQYLDTDAWYIIPANRSVDYIQELPVVDESHKKVIQQESFETLGSSRKLIIRGFVLGDEGSITCIWRNVDVESPSNPAVTYNETVIGRRLLEYLANYQGPHILKSPFGDVWEVQFEGPEYKWAPAGALEATLNWVETTTNGVGEI